MSETGHDAAHAQMLAATVVVPVQVGLDVALTGNFNPRIFSPAWLAREGVVRDSEATASEFVPDDEAILLQMRDFTLEVTPDQFRLVSLHEGLQLSHRDFIINAFSLLRHTPIESGSIGRHMHVAFPGEAAALPGSALDWTRFLVQTPWQGIVGAADAETVAVTCDGPDGSRALITVEPSYAPGATLFMSCQYEYKFAEVETHESAVDSVVSVLKEGWESAARHSRGIFEGIVNQFNATLNGGQL